MEPTLDVVETSIRDNGGPPWPKDVVREILLRFPLKSMLRFKCISKHYYKIIKSPSFISERYNWRNKKKILEYPVCEDVGCPTGAISRQ
ncbi:F-box/kelch-repeat protein At2g43270-like isoform X3 [Lycium ferocissimum]|uniref:F-box/kelch-repeat protein At2g43270-like isoform X3 n=1 Tax=Lycium ferocissimum TaxID=112874 RepID=UPI0028159864|nr:F-box/kelch-repeat protein At2g43270-like isoform X3 [Lycium ferocissimum]